MNNSLYHLTQDFINAMDNIHELMEDGADISQEAYFDTLEMLKMPLEEKVENIVKYMKSLEALAEAKKAEAKRLQESAASDLKKAEYFKNYMADNLQKVGIKDLQAGVFKVSFRKGSEVVQVDESKLPLEFWVPQPMKPLSKAELKNNIKAGLEIPGVQIVRNPDSLVVK